MKRSLALFILGTMWTLLTGLVFIHFPRPLLEPKIPVWEHREKPLEEIRQKPPSLFFSSLEQRWRSERRLAASA